jgi:hypothetical protein
MELVYAILVAIGGNFLLKVGAVFVVYIANNGTTDNFTDKELLQAYKYIEFVYEVAMAVTIYHCYFGGN